MAKRQSKNVMDKLKKMQAKLEEKGGELPWMMTCDADVWLELTVSIPSIQEHSDAGPKESWSCYRCDAWVESKEELMNLEVPFWAMEAFIGAIIDKGSEGDEIDMLYMRTIGDQGRNMAQFK